MWALMNVAEYLHRTGAEKGVQATGADNGLFNSLNPYLLNSNFVLLLKIN